MTTPPDVLVINARHEEDLAAHRADLLVTIRGSSLVTGRAALSKAKEVSALVNVLDRCGVPADAISLERVHAEVQSGFLGTSSTATYSLRVACHDLALLPDVMGAVTAAKNSSLDRIEWHYPESAERQAQWLTRCVTEANVKAQATAKALGARIVGVHRLTERGLWDTGPAPRGETPAPTMTVERARAQSVQLGFELGNQKKVGLRIEVQYRVEGFSANAG